LENHTIFGEVTGKKVVSSFFTGHSAIIIAHAQQWQMTQCCSVGHKQYPWVAANHL